MRIISHNTGLGVGTFNSTFFSQVVFPGTPASVSNRGIAGAWRPEDLRKARCWRNVEARWWSRSCRVGALEVTSCQRGWGPWACQLRGDLHIATIRYVFLLSKVTWFGDWIDAVSCVFMFDGWYLNLVYSQIFGDPLSTVAIIITSKSSRTIWLAIAGLPILVGDRLSHYPFLFSVTVGHTNHY